MKTTLTHRPKQRGINDDTPFEVEASLNGHDTPLMAVLVNFLLGLSPSDKHRQLEYRPAEFYAFVDGVEGTVLF